MVAEIVGAIQSVLAQAQAPVGLHEPRFAGRERGYVTECLDTGWVSSAGAFVTRFEEKLREITGQAGAVAVVNGTCALSVALALAGVRPGDEVIVPALTFVATANAAVHAGAVPHFADSETKTLGLDPDKLARHLESVSRVEHGQCRNSLTGRPIRALVPVHVFGHPADMDRLLAVAERFGLVVVEDAAEALGTLYKGRHVGRHGKLAILSFNGNKTVTTGGGGAILTDDPALAAEARHLTSTAKRPHPFEFFHDRTAFNFRMPNLNAALGLGQLERLDELVESKRGLARRYQEAFRHIPGATFFAEPEFARSNYWLNAILLADPVERDAVIVAAGQAGFQCRPVWTPMHRLPMYADCPRMDLSTAEDIASRCVNLPSSAFL